MPVSASGGSQDHHVADLVFPCSWALGDGVPVDLCASLASGRGQNTKHTISQIWYLFLIALITQRFDSRT